MLKGYKMNRFQLAIMGTLVTVFTACGSEERTNVAAATTSIQADAGVDQRVVINESITLVGKVENLENSELIYEWEEQGKILGTTQILTYLPTEVGTHLLSFTVQNSDGVSSTDNMIVIVTSQEINTSIPDISNTLKTEYLRAVNEARTQTQDCGSKGVFTATTVLSWNDKLYRAAYEHVQDLIASQTFSHDGSGTESDWSGYVLAKKSTQIERVENHGYSWERLGENLAGGAVIDNVEKAVQSWLESDNHCENLMNPLFKEMGISMLRDESSLYTHYWGQNFGTPK
ncbi:MAG: SCP-like extracellular [uncultured Sulfurovum sp.]|uniref:SCP-like extracellular n=1 Tax=uncultured Sulfurovum sp. TaxID=269237 RepID=A0A6S6U645_9BACT|nr:MAG: SCP-like extracellular [uncultured Sulfurovum sp.]